ncbi:MULTISPECIES: ATP-binding protein [unclassified Janthinobacterium]|uniref:ATP-binding protein n=1 Tax=unclassified Janthinobacterium TaxID=2610881 RepID=UPI00160D632F|nr:MULTISPECIES: ATP-binding protein [unclassified Janthinobacterium]MBB5610279.1 signal transduction histidine kinase/PAS domain-containing protein [Janthinobacterium sp. S3T4]MBB5615702.1 signal transduction histidine kinase/PAS domain-containing protein [Janthinobacterium sp. S3M3]
MNQLISSLTDRAKVLLVSKATNDVRELLYMLDRHNLGTGVAGDIDEGVQLAASGTDLILLDTALAGTNISASCMRLRNAGGRHGVPLLLMSATPSAEEQGRSVGAGASDYIKMPFDARDVAEKILMELALHKAEAADAKADASFAADIEPLRPLHPQTLEVNYHSILAGSPDAVLLFDIDNKVLVDANHLAQDLFGLPQAALLQGGLAPLFPGNQADGQPSMQLLQQKMDATLQGRIAAFRATCRHRDHHPIECEIRLMRLAVPGRQLVHARVADLTERNLAEALRAGQNTLLEMVAKGAPLIPTLDRLLLLIEGQSRGVYCSIMLLDDDGRHMHSASGPSLPPDYMALLEGAEIGPGVGSCGTAMFLGEAVVVSDIMHDPLWAPYRELAVQFGLRACWSRPIFSQDGIVLGSFAMYYREVRSPNAQDLSLIDAATDMAGIAISRMRHERELQRHRTHLEELVAERTAALTLAKEQSEQANLELAAALENLSITQAELVRRDKLAALGALVAGIAHELNTPIGNSLVVATTMAENTRTIQAGLQDGLRRSELDTYLAQAGEADAIMLRNLQRAADLVSSFKQIAVDRTRSQRRHFPLRRFIAEQIVPMSAQLKEARVRLTQDVPDELAMDSYPGPLGQVLANLLENCLRHAFDGGRNGDKNTIAIAAHASDDAQTITVSISDNGAGISAHDLPHIYDPFFTTKLGSGSSGLGLHVAHNIVTGVLGGHIDATSASDGGTTFTLQLPAVAPQPADS